MKFFISITLITFATASFAASERGIYDLQYLPTSGTTYGITNLGLVSGKVESSMAETKVKGWTVAQEVGHAFTDRLLLSAELNFQHLDTESDISGSSDSTNTTKGISDPQLNGRFRVLDADYRLDLLSSFLISTGDSVSEGHERNIKEGGNILSLGVEAGHKTESYQYVGILNYSRVLEADYKFDEDNITGFAHNEYLVGVAGLFKAAEKSFIKGTLSANFVEGFEFDDVSSTNATTTYIFGAEYQHLCTQDLLLRAGLNVTDLHSSGYDSYQLYTLVAGANYQF